MKNIEIIKCDITLLQVDAIVNAARPSLLGGGGVDGAIHRAAGCELIKACIPLKGCRTGEAKITPGFNLPAKYVIHTVGPVWEGGSKDELGLLSQCYINSFELALKNKIKTIAFSSISTGAYGLPKGMAAKIAIDVSYTYQNNFDKIYLVAYDTEMFDQYMKYLFY